MKLTKFEHACVVIEVDSKKLVIDPGELTELPELSGVVAVFISHIHGDHLSLTNIKNIINGNPEVVIIGSAEVLEQLTGVKAEKQTAESGKTIKVASFELKIIGHDHAVIYEKSPCENRGVIVNNIFYHPGDSLVIPTQAVKVLGVPTHAPWLKTSEAMDFVGAVQPEIVVPIHNGLLNKWGLEFTYGWLKRACDDAGAIFRPLETQDELEFS